MVGGGLREVRVGDAAAVDGQRGRPQLPPNLSGALPKVDDGQLLPLLLVAESGRGPGLRVVLVGRLLRALLRPQRAQDRRRQQIRVHCEEADKGRRAAVHELRPLQLPHALIGSAPGLLQQDLHIQVRL